VGGERGRCRRGRERQGQVGAGAGVGVACGKADLFLIRPSKRV